MMNRKLKFGKRPIAFLLSLMLLLPSVALANDTDVSDSVAKTEVIQVDLNAEIEKALQEDGNLEDGLEIIIGGSEENESENDGLEAEKDISGEDADSPKEISPRGVDYPVKELNIVGVKGSFNGYEASELINCGKGKHIASNASAETYYSYDKSTPLTIIVQYVGTHLSWQQQTTTGDIYMTNSAPYDNVLSGVASTGFKIDYILTPRDTQAEQTVFEFSYRAYQSNGINIYPEKYYRRLTVNWSNAISDATPPSNLQYDAKATMVMGFNDKMEYSSDAVNWFTLPSGITNLNVYLIMDYQKDSFLYVRYKATDTTPPSAIAPYRIPGLTRPAPNVSLGYDSASGQFVFYNLTPGVRYDLSTDLFANGISFEAPDSGAIGLSGEFLQPGNRLYLRLSNTDTEGPSAMKIFVIPQLDGSRANMSSTADLQNIEDLDTIYLANEGIVENMENGIIAIAYDEENANSKTELISNLEVTSAIAE